MGCKYCYANGGNYCSSEGVMKVETAKATLDTFLKRYRNIRIIQFFGGEPTFNLDIIEFVCKYLKKNLKRKKLIIYQLTELSQMEQMSVIDLLS